MEKRYLEENNTCRVPARVHAIVKTRGNSMAICSNALAIENNMCIILRKAQVGP